MIIPIKQIILEMTSATANYQALVPKKSLPKNNPIVPSENASRIMATTKATSIGEPTTNVATKTIEIQTKEMAKAAAKNQQG